MLCQDLPQKHQRIQAGNCQFVSVLFMISVIIDVHRYRCEICTLVSEIHEDVDLVLGIKMCLNWKEFELMGLLFKISKQIPAHLFKGTHCSKT